MISTPVNYSAFDEDVSLSEDGTEGNSTIINDPNGH